MWLKSEQRDEQRRRVRLGGLSQTMVGSWKLEQGFPGCDSCFKGVALAAVWKIECRGLRGEAGKQRSCRGLRRG